MEAFINKTEIAKSLGYANLSECGPLIDRMIRDGLIKPVQAELTARVGSNSYSIGPSTVYLKKEA